MKGLSMMRSMKSSRHLLLAALAISCIGVASVSAQGAAGAPVAGAKAADAKAAKDTPAAATEETAEKDATPVYDDTPEGHARKSYDEYLAVKAKGDATLKEIVDRYNKAVASARDTKAKEGATDEEKTAADKAVTDIVAEYRAKQPGVEAASNEAKDEFAKLFTAVKLEDWNADQDEALVFDGLIGSAEMHTRQEAYGKALAAYESFLSHMPDHKQRVRIMTGDVMNCLKHQDDLGASAKRAMELAKLAPEAQQPDCYLDAGDMYAMAGMPDKAVETYNAGLKLIPEQLERRDPRANAKRYLTGRANMVGKDAPEIDSKTWLGGEAKPLSKHKGQIVVVDFWATWCPPCVAAMPELDHFAKEYADKGVTVLGVTRYYEYGRNALSMDALSKGELGEVERGFDTEEKFMAHLTSWRERVKPSYPFVVGTTEDAKAYSVSGIPTMVVVNPEGKVALYVVGADEVAVKATVKSLLKKQTEAKKAAPAEEAPAGDKASEASAG